METENCEIFITKSPFIKIQKFCFAKKIEPGYNEIVQQLVTRYNQWTLCFIFLIQFWIRLWNFWISFRFVFLLLSSKSASKNMNINLYQSQEKIVTKNLFEKNSERDFQFCRGNHAICYRLFLCGSRWDLYLDFYLAF